MTNLGTKIETSPLAWLEDCGEIGQLIKNKDWAQTPLGPLEGWPQSLKSITSVCLMSKFFPEIPSTAKGDSVP